MVDTHAAPLVSPPQQASFEMPADYMCAGCGLRGFKLWRPLGYHKEGTELRCANCLEKEYPSADLSTLDDRGCVLNQGERVDQIGYHMPAIPLRDGRGYSTYAKLEEGIVAWWHSLPTRSAR